MRKNRSYALLLAGSLLLLLLLGACSAPAADKNADTAAGVSFPQLDAAQIEKAEITYTSVMDEATSEVIRDPDTLQALCTALNETGAGKESVAWNEVTDSVNGGEGYAITLYDAQGETGTFRFVLNPTRGYLRYDAPGADAVYFDPGEAALEALSAFYPA